MRVLVVEDQALTALAVVLELERAGYQTCGPAYTTSEALALARAHRPKVALVDISLEEPGAGIELAERLHAEFGIDILFMTSQVELARANAHSALGLIAKPFALNDVPESVDVVASLSDRESAETASKVPEGLELFERAPPTKRNDERRTRTSVSEADSREFA
jgi:CheY-like chemotaxis protein